MAKRRYKSSSYPTQPDKEFEVHIIDAKTIEIRDMERDDYLLTPLRESMVKRLSGGDNKVSDIIDNVYVVIGEDLLLETESKFGGIRHGESLLSKVRKKSLTRKSHRDYNSTGAKEVSDGLGYTGTKDFFDRDVK